MTAGVVIVGAGHAGVAAAAALRREDYAGTITVLGDEPDAPYQRPPLSKAYLLGAATAESLALHSAGFYADKEIVLRSGSTVRAVERERREVVLGDGERLPYADLVLATGATARRLPVPGGDLAGVISLRSLADARTLKEAVRGAASVVVLGGGFIGLEFAAALSGSNVDVTVLDVAPRLLGRAVSRPVSAHVAAVHGDRGVRLVLATGVAEIVADAGRAVGVRDADGREHPADLVVVGVGALPRTRLAEDAGLHVADGIVVDASLRTSDPHISAIGDCARVEGIRLESVQNATDQGGHVARVLAGTAPGGYAEVPLFWSDQKGLRLQMVGLVRESDELQVIGDVDGGRFSVLAFRGGRLVAVESVNRPADHMAARRILATDQVVTPADVRTPGFMLRDLARTAAA